MHKSYWFYIFQIVLFSLSCRSMPEYSVTPEMSRNEADDSFLVNAAHWSLHASEMARLGISRAADSTVCLLAKNTHHYSRKMYGDLQGLAKGAVLLPLAASHSSWALRADMAAKEGDDFDTAYVSQHASDYELIVEYFVYEIEHGQFKPVVDYASRHLPELMHRRKMADSVLQEQ